ncbi:Uncharacterised protein [uncultured archaeon]|nr:Uncharacterised protein [uncultured archaeon]
MELQAASTIFSGVSKSGSPTPMSMISTPEAESFLAMAEIFRVVDSWMEAILVDTIAYSPPSLCTSLTAASTALLA